jgi:uncharacterized protein YndB with AHSA1/START domain
MDSDIATRIGAVTREVRNGEREGRPARSVVASRTYDTTIDDVWEAISDPARLPRWFLPVSGDLRLGGRYQLEGNAGGTITQCEPPRHLAVTWEFGSAVSWLDVRLAEDSGGGTRLELEHEALLDDHWETYGPGAAGVGWDLALMGLTAHLAGGAPVDPERAASWSTSAEGKAFIRGSSEDWCRAGIEAGADAQSAAAAAARTTSFYTGEGAA